MNGEILKSLLKKSFGDKAQLSSDSTNTEYWIEVDVETLIIINKEKKWLQIKRSVINALEGKKECPICDETNSGKNCSCSQCQ